MGSPRKHRRRPAPPRISEEPELLRQIAGTLKEVLWIRDLAQERILYVSPSFAAVFGRPVESLLASPRVWIDAIHPDDRERVLSKALNEARSGDDLMEYRIVRPDGTVRLLRDRSYPVRNAKGEVYRLTGLVEDITDRKRIP
jgi:PAS domain S-box-containing protein